MREKLKEFLIKSILQDAKGTIIYCDNCGSPFTKYYDVHKINTKDKIQVDYHIKCLKCGSHARMIEVWDKLSKGEKQ